jgi:nucleotide-binding universal stress UspA family protein
MSANGKPDAVGGVIVVGVDGSAGAREALRWALAEARVRKAQLRAVHAWMFGYVGGVVARYPYAGGALGSLTSLGLVGGDLQREAEELLERAIAEVAGETEGVEIERKVVEGAAAQVLVNAVTENDLLVVGSRGHGGFSSLLLGSVSLQCAHHARCPVVIVHASVSSETS